MNGETVAAFEREFASFVGARYAIALNSGTSTLHTALVALGVDLGDRVAVPPLTMSATTMAVLHAGAVPVFWDVDPKTWLMERPPDQMWLMPVSLFGLHVPGAGWDVDDAAQTLRTHGGAACTSYSFQQSKVLALGEGGMLVTNDENLATTARAFSSLGYRLQPDQPRIDPARLKSPTFCRHYSLGWNYRMTDLVATEGLKRLAQADELLANRRQAAAMYREAVHGCAWLIPQQVPEEWSVWVHDYWTYAVAMERQADPHAQAETWEQLAQMVEWYGGERPYAAWRLTYQEPAFRHLAPDGTCPVAESLQSRLMLFQTNRLDSAERNATALRKALQDIG